MSSVSVVRVSLCLVMYKHCLTRRRLFDFTVLNYWTVLLTRSNQLLFAKPKCPPPLSFRRLDGTLGKPGMFLPGKYTANVTRVLSHVLSLLTASPVHTSHIYKLCRTKYKTEGSDPTHLVHFLLLKEFIGYFWTFLLCDWLLGGYASVFNVFALLAPPTHHHYPPSFLATPSFPLVRCPGAR